MTPTLWICPQGRETVGHVFWWRTSETHPRCTLCGWPMVQA
jgi:hypothetical protein